MITLNPYLVFKDNCEEAFNFYKSVFGGDILFIGRYKDVPSAAKQLFPLAADEKIMHMSLKINDTTVIMGSDSMEEQNPSIPAFANFHLYINIDSKEETYRIFNNLSAGGKIVMPIDLTFWDSYFGMLTDKFGVNWKISFDPGKSGASSR